MSRLNNPYGNGTACELIINTIQNKVFK